MILGRLAIRRLGSGKIWYHIGKGKNKRQDGFCNMPINEKCKVLAHDDAGPGYRFLVLDAPRLAAELQPGQFVHVKVPTLEASALRRPFSVFDAEGGKVTILYKRVGRGTEALAYSPYRIEIPAGKKLEIKVVNTWPNRLIGDAVLRERGETPVTWSNWAKAWGANEKLLPAGLLGPVKLYRRMSINARRDCARRWARAREVMGDDDA